MLVVVSPRQPETSVELDDPLVTESFGVEIGCLHACHHRRNVVVGFTLDCSPVLAEIGWLTWMQFI